MGRGVRMSEEQILEQLYDLIDDRKSLMGSDEETNSIYKKDIQAIKTILEENQLLKLELSGYRQSILNDKEMLGLKEENTQLKIQISAREEEHRRLKDTLVEVEDWLRPAILQLMEIAKQDFFWITNQQIDNAKLVPLIFTLMEDRSVKFEKLKRGVSDVED